MSILLPYICCGITLVVGLLLALLSLGIRDLVLAKRSGSRARAARGAGLALVPVAVVALLWNPWLRSVAVCFQEPYRPPPDTLDEHDLAGTWETTYSDGHVDRLVLRADGTFKQVYYDPGQEDNYREKAWEDWWLERLPDGSVRIHLQGATYYPEEFVVPDLGSSSESCPEDDWGCEQRYLHWPYAFYDPITAETVPMQGALVLNVRRDALGSLLLYHMRTGPGQLVLLTDCQAEHFRRVANE